MYKLLIVDDEYCIREGLTHDVDWKSINIEVVGSVFDGLEALEKIQQLRPDIVLADICMNRMSGVEMAEKLRELQDDIKIIFLSGHDDFIYTQKAIELKIFDYLLKPVLMSKLLSTVSRAVEEIRQEQDLKSRIAVLEENFINNRSLALEKFFGDTVNTVLYDRDEIESRAQALGIPTENCGYCAAVLELDELYDLKIQQQSQKMYAQLLAIKEIAEEYAKPFNFCFTMIRAPHVILFLGCSSASGKSVSQNIYNVLNTIRKGIRSLLQTTCTIGISECLDSIFYLGECYAQAINALDYKITVGSDCIIQITDVTQTDKDRFAYPKTIEKKLLEAINIMDIQLIRSSVSQFIDILGQRNYSKAQIRAVLSELISVLTRRFLESGIDLYSAFNDFWINPYSVLNHNRTLPEITQWLVTIILQAVAVQEEERRASIKNIVTDVQKLIYDGYADADLSLSTLAGKVYLSPAYLSKLYKKETGETYVEFLTNVRMNEAKKLLKDTNLKSAEIGLHVGYLNAQYFCYLFKKYTGMSPIEYREIHAHSL